MPTAIKSYDYQADGRLSFSHDLINSQWDRSYSYDHAGRITQALSGAEARNEGTTNLQPYKQTFVYDALGHLVERPYRNFWSGAGGMFSPSHQDYQNNRNVTWQYDADGNLTDTGSAQFSDYVQYTVDAAGRNSRTVAVTMDLYHDPDSTVWGSSVDLTQSFDGDGNKVKRLASDTTIDYTEGNTTTTTTTYLVRSSVLNQVLTELSETGQKQRSFVYLGNSVLASQQQSTNSSQAVLWEHRDPGNASYRVTGSGGGLAISQQSAELDPLGNDAGLSNPIPNPQHKQTWSYPGFGDTGMSGDSQCILDGDFQPCSLVFRAAAAGGLSSMDVPWSISGTVPNRTPVWVPDNSKDKWIPDPEHGIGTYVIGDGGHYEWVPTGDVTTSIQSRQPQKTQAVVPLQSSGQLRAEFKKLLGNSTCADFVSALVEEVQSKMPDSDRMNLGIEDLFENIAGQGGYVLTEAIVINNALVSGTISGSIWGGNAQVKIPTRRYYSTDSAKSITHRIADATRDYLATAFHESFHHLSKSGWHALDSDLGRAAFKITGDTSYLPGEKGTELSWSSYFDNQLMKKCMPDRVRSGEPRY